MTTALSSSNPRRPKNRLAASRSRTAMVMWSKFLVMTLPPDYHVTDGSRNGRLHRSRGPSAAAGAERAPCYGGNRKGESRPVLFGLGLVISAGALVVATTAWGVADPVGRCASVKAKGAGIGLAAGLACQATGTRSGRGPSSKCLAGAEKKLRRVFAKAEAKGPCGVSDDAATIGD